MSKRPFDFDTGDCAAAARHPGLLVGVENLMVAGGAHLTPGLAAQGENRQKNQVGPRMNTDKHQLTSYLY